jgi:hypothetical protein
MNASKKIANPFPGLRPFESNEYRLFFGREGQSDALITRLQRARFLAVVGTSGSGKSSLVRAGLLPALRGGMMAGAGSSWRIAIMRPGSDPIGNLAIALADQEVLLEAGGGLPAAEVPAVIEASLRRGSLGLVDVARQARLPEHEKLLVVVDQFEELFRFRAARAASSTADDASAFVKLLLEASQQRELSIYVVPTMRSDFLGDCAQFQGLPEAINDGQYLIPRMTRDERRFAITGPVGVTRGKITEPLVNRLMNDVGDNPDQLPILQHALMRTWDYWAGHPRNGEPIGLEHYDAVGTMTDALSEHADEAFKELDEPGRLVAEILFKALTERGADNREIRRPTCLKDICEIAGASAAEVRTVVEVFRDGGRSFLMPPAGVPLEPETVIDISHESLIRNWRRLKGWVKDEADSARTYRRLADAAMDYQACARGLLDDVTLQFVLNWRKQLNPARAWGVRYQPEFDAAMGYLEESRIARDARIKSDQERERRELETTRAFGEKQARSARRMRWLSTGMAVMFVLAFAAAVWGFNAKRKAINSQRHAEDSAKAAQKAQMNALVSEKNARDEQANAEKSANDALTAQRRAVVAREEAKQQQAKAVKSATVAKAAQAKAEKSKKELEASNALLTTEKTKTSNALDRSTYNVLGVSAFQREDYSTALQSFASALVILELEQPSASDDFTRDSLFQARVSLLSNLGDTQRTLGESDKSKLAEAVASYECARTTLSPEPEAASHARPDPCLLAGEVARKLVNDELARRKAEKEAGKEAENDAKRRSEVSDWTMFDVLYGAAHAYRDQAISGREDFNSQLAHEQDDSVRKESNLQSSLPPAVKEGFKKAEEYFLQALKIQEKWLKATDPRIASGYQELAYSYLNNGELEAAEAAFKHAVELRHLNKASSELDGTERAALAGSLRELGEFYRGQEGQYDKVVKVFNEMITLQEEIPVYDLAQDGQAIANSYIDLGQIHLASGKSALAEDAFRVAKILQRTAVLFQQKEKVQHSISQEKTVVKQLSGNLDELGDAYVKLGKLTDAEACYVTALSQRYGDDSDLEKSYDKLTKLYRRDDFEKYEEAERYNKLLIEFYENKPQSAEYAGALMQLGALYALIPNRTSDAESSYRSARAIYKARRNWWYENVIVYRLSKLYEKQGRLPEQERELKDRSDTLAEYFGALVAHKTLEPNDPVTLVSEYLQAVNALGDFYKRKNDWPNAAVAYARAFDASQYITGNIYNEKILKFYATVLDHYQAVLIKLNDNPLATRVSGVAQAVKEKLRQDNERKQQNALQVQQSSSEATYSTPQ